MFYNQNKTLFCDSKHKHSPQHKTQHLCRQTDIKQFMQFPHISQLELLTSFCKKKYWGECKYFCNYICAKLDMAPHEHCFFTVYLRLIHLHLTSHLLQNESYSLSQNPTTLTGRRQSTLWCTNMRLSYFITLTTLLTSKRENKFDYNSDYLRQGHPAC